MNHSLVAASVHEAHQYQQNVLITSAPTFSNTKVNKNQGFESRMILEKEDNKLLKIGFSSIINYLSLYVAGFP